MDDDADYITSCGFLKATYKVTMADMLEVIDYEEY